MLRKILIYIIFFSFLHLVGCYSTVSISANEYFDSNKKKTIYLQYNGTNIKLEPGQYFVMRDTLYYDETGNNNYPTLKKKIAIDEIQKIEYEEYDETKMCVAGGISGLIVIGILIISLGSFSFITFN